MTDLDYFDQFDDEGAEKSVSKRDSLPDWVSDSNSSLAAYQAIQSLYKEKMQYIRSHSKKSHYTKKSSYHISKSKVARAAGLAKPNAIFHSVDYASKLTKELNDKNALLLASKEKALLSRSSSRKNMSRKELETELRARDRYKEISELKVDEIVDLTLKRLPLAVKRQLHLA
jgi:hypothetical protein